MGAFFAAAAGEVMGGVGCVVLCVVIEEWGGGYSFLCCQDFGGARPFSTSTGGWMSALHSGRFPLTTLVCRRMVTSNTRLRKSMSGLFTSKSLCSRDPVKEKYAEPPDTGVHFLHNAWLEVHRAF